MVGRPGARGVADIDGLVIAVHTKIEPQKRRLVAWHETVHAVTAAYNSGSHLTEAQVQGISQGLFQVMRDNPELVRFIMDEV